MDVMTLAHRRRIKRLALLLERSDAGTLYARAPEVIRQRLHRRFALQYARYHDEVLAWRRSARQPISPDEPAPPPVARLTSRAHATGHSSAA